MKKALKILGALIALVVLGGAGFVSVQVMSFNSSMAKVYDVAVPALSASTDPLVIERGEHLARGLASCATSDCHGGDLAGGKTIDMGPVALITGPNVSAGGALADYSDGELVRLIRHSVKKDGRSTILMPMHELNWLPEKDVIAIVSWMRTMPAVKKANGPLEVGLLGKILDRMDLVHLDVARRIDHANLPTAPEPSPTAAYGAYIARGCMGCHGATLSGGPMPGAPPEMAVPSNITPHETGLKAWSYDDFKQVLATGTRPDGRKLDPFMPFESLSNMNETEKSALWAYLRSVEPKAFGGR